jgi:hypothetical protein
MTAEEIYQKQTGCVINHHDIKIAMIKFAKLHVEAALKAASEKVVMIDEGSFNSNEEWEDFYVTDKDSILRSYPLDKIK